jgi:hypothetical protein
LFPTAHFGFKYFAMAAKRHENVPGRIFAAKLVTFGGNVVVVDGTVVVVEVVVEVGESVVVVVVLVGGTVVVVVVVVVVGGGDVGVGLNVTGR